MLTNFDTSNHKNLAFEKCKLICMTSKLSHCWQNQCLFVWVLYLVFCIFHCPVRIYPLLYILPETFFPFFFFDSAKKFEFGIQSHISIQYQRITQELFVFLEIVPKIFILFLNKELWLVHHEMWWSFQSRSNGILGWPMRVTLYEKCFWNHQERFNDSICTNENKKKPKLCQRMNFVFDIMKGNKLQLKICWVFKQFSAYKYTNHV